MVREVSRKSGTILKEDDLVVAVENWRETGDVSKAVVIAVNWIEWLGKNKLSSIDDSALKHSVIGDFTYNSKTGVVSKVKSGGHSLANINFLQANGIKYNIVKEYSNGVRVGIIRTNGRISTISPDAEWQL